MSIMRPALPLNAKAFAAAICVSVMLPEASAQAFDAVRLHAAAPGRDGGRVGGVLSLGTDYLGSDERRNLVLPTLDYQWGNGAFAGITNGLGFNLSGSPGLQYGLRLTADLGRDAGRSEALRGMGDIDPKPEAGAFLNTALSREIMLTSSVRFGAGNAGRGLVFDLGTGYSVALGTQWRLGVGMAVTAANAEYMRAYFGVDAAQSAASGYAVFQPGAGVRDARANVSLTYLAGGRLSVTTALSGSALLGEAADSPVTRDKTSVTGALAVGYAF